MQGTIARLHTAARLHQPAARPDAKNVEAKVMVAQNNRPSRQHALCDPSSGGKAVPRGVANLSKSSEHGLESASCAGVDGGRSFGLAWLCERSPAHSSRA